MSERGLLARLMDRRGSAAVEFALLAPTVISIIAGSLSTAQINLIKATFSNGQSAVLVTASYSHSLAFFPKSMSELLGGPLTPSYRALQLKS